MTGSWPLGGVPFNHKQDPGTSGRGPEGELEWNSPGRGWAVPPPGGVEGVLSICFQEEYGGFTAYPSDSPLPPR